MNIYNVSVCEKQGKDEFVVDLFKVQTESNEDAVNIIKKTFPKYKNKKYIIEVNEIGKDISKE